jgi:4-alpha-glucanotransferase
MDYPRQSGVLLHPTSLPGQFGIGSMNGAAYEWVDFLA